MMGAVRTAAAKRGASKIHVVLFRPVIGANTGNVGRTCLGFDARLHLIRPLGFDLGEREVKRAGLDHWEHVDLHVHDDWQSFKRSTFRELAHGHQDESTADDGDRDKDFRGNVYLVSKRLKLGCTRIADATFPPAMGPGSADVALVFGNETDGLSGLEEEARKSLPALYLPMNDEVIRSYNLSNAVAMAVYEADRQRRMPL